MNVETLTYRGGSGFVYDFTYEIPDLTSQSNNPFQKFFCVYHDYNANIKRGIWPYF